MKPQVLSDITSICILPLEKPSHLKNDKYYVGWSNPSIAYNPKDNLFYCNVRCTNYTLKRNRKHLTYCAPTSKDKHFETINYLGTSPNPFEIPFNFSPVMEEREHFSDKWGLEDARISLWNNSVCLNGTRRDYNNAQMGRIECNTIIKEYDQWKVKEFRRWDGLDNDCTFCEKNWMPVEFRPNVYIAIPDPVFACWCNPNDWHLQPIIGNDRLHLATTLPGTLRGSSQLIGFNDGYICVLHTATIDETGQYQYLHYFATYSNDFKMTALSKPFKFEGKDVEFCCGMCFKFNLFYISYSLMDNDARLMVISEGDMSNLLKDEKS